MDYKNRRLRTAAKINIHTKILQEKYLETSEKILKSSRCNLVNFYNWERIYASFELRKKVLYCFLFVNSSIYSTKPHKKNNWKAELDNLDECVSQNKIFIAIRMILSEITDYV